MEEVSGIPKTMIRSILTEYLMKKKVAAWWVLHMQVPLRPSSHSSTSVQFRLGTTFAICALYAIHVTSHPHTAAIRTRLDAIPQLPIQLVFSSFNEKFYTHSTKFYTSLIQNFLRILKIPNIYIKCSQKC